MKKFGEYILSSGFHLKYFVQKLKGYKSLRLYKTIHGADDSKTLKFSGVLNKRILERKPNLKLCSNHYKSGPRIYRVWNHGTAISDGKGWYTALQKQKVTKVNG